jgi:hypothetical protein
MVEAGETVSTTRAMALWDSLTQTLVAVDNEGSGAG